MKKKNPNRRKKTDRSEVASVLNYFIGKAFIELFKATMQPIPKTPQQTFDIDYEEITEQKQISQ